jgi:hypothetical protein
MDKVMTKEERRAMFETMVKSIDLLIRFSADRPPKEEQLDIEVQRFVQYYGRFLP